LCEVRQGCASSAAAAPSTTKACLYGVEQSSECPADVVAPAGGPHSSSARSLNGSAIMVVLLVLLSCLFDSGASYNTSLTTCGNPSSPKTSEGYECTGALFNLVDINSINIAKDESGCVAALLGFSTQLKGYHCLSFKNCPGANCMCEVRQGCASSAAAAPSTTKACLYGVEQSSECPADVVAPSSPASSGSYHNSAIVFGALLVAVFASAAFSI